MQLSEQARTGTQEISPVFMTKASRFLSNPGFFPWHRAFLTMLERAIQIARNDDALRLPYWNWAGEKINESKIWKPLGGAQNGDPPDNCVNTGYFNTSEWHSDPSQCITRNMGDFYEAQESQSQLDEDQNLSSYDEFRKKTESGGNRHNSLHSKFGKSDMRSPLSPLDPVFYFVRFSPSTTKFLL